MRENTVNARKTVNASLSTLLIQVLSPPAREHVNFAVGMRTDRLATPEVSKRTIIQHDRWSPTEKIREKAQGNRRIG
jgi:hypothetical protein